MFMNLDFKQWFARWQARLKRQPDSWEASRRRMNAHNPAVIPRNHRVEEALAAAVERADYSVMDKLLEVLSQPFQDSPDPAGYHLPPPPAQAAQDADLARALKDRHPERIGHRDPANHHRQAGMPQGISNGLFLVFTLLQTFFNKCGYP